MPSEEPVRTPDERSPEGRVAALEEEVADLHARLAAAEREAESSHGDLRRARIRADELQTALQQKHEQFLGMLARLQNREEQAVRRAGELAERTREAEAARTNAVDAERRLRRIMAEAGRLMGPSLDSRAALASIARLATPELADWCIIDLVDDQGLAERAAVQGPDEEAAGELAGRLLDECDPGQGLGLHRFLDGDDREMVRDADEAAFRSLGCGPEMISAMSELGLARMLVVPMVTRGKLIGAMALMAGDHRPDYGEEERVLARELAYRAALAVDAARLYDAALAGSRAKSEFLAVISHELRTPLSAIIGYADLIRAGIAGEVTDMQTEQLGRIRAAADHLLALIEEILSFSQLEAGRARIRVETVDATELARELVDMVQPIASEKGLEVTLEAPGRSVAMTTDGAKLRQILLNLLSNAIKFTDEGGVRLVLETVGDRVRWRVIDTGIGIDADHLEQIFTPFWQAESSRTRTREGTGLGLSVSRALARALGGDITIESEPGRGSTFTLELPAHGAVRDGEP